MTHELFKIYLKQKRRNFRWMTFIAEAYFIVIAWMFMFIGYEFGQEYIALLQTGSAWSMIKPLCLSIIILDFMASWLFKHDRGIMDDYVKTKPISEKHWNRFLMLANLIDFNNWFFPLLIAPVCFVIMPWYVATIAIITLFSTCYINGISVMSLRKAKGWEYKAGVWTILFFFILAVIFMPIWIVNIAAIVTLYYYLFHLHRYNESKISLSAVKSVARMSYISLQFLVIMRAKRVRAMMLMGLFFTAMTYIYVPQLGGEDGLMDFVAWEYIFMGIFFSPMLFGTLGFGVEANYFHGLESKPVGVQTLLETKYYTQMILSAITTTLTIPIIFLFDINPWMILSIAIYVIGFMNLFSLASCLYGKRIDLFANGFMNMQGANWTFNLYTLAPLLPMFLWFGLWPLLKDNLNLMALITAALGLIGILIHKTAIHWLATLFYKNKYKLLERYTS